MSNQKGLMRRAQNTTLVRTWCNCATHVTSSARQSGLLPKVKEAEIPAGKHHVAVVRVGVNDSGLQQLSHAGVHPHLDHRQLLGIIQFPLRNQMTKMMMTGPTVRVSKKCKKECIAAAGKSCKKPPCACHRSIPCRELSALSILGM
eukprot:scaffold172161_cov46-Prasinocladus_malaysianus.AAC.1